MTLGLGRRDFSGEPGDRLGLDPELALPHQGLARQLQEDAVEAWSGHSAEKSPR